MMSLPMSLLYFGGGMGFITLVWLFLKLVSRWRRKKKKTLSAEQRETKQKEEDLARESLIREQQVQDAVESAFRALKERMDGNPYQLPLYLMIGPEGAGKTYLLKSFGLVPMHTPQLEQAADFMEIWCSEHLLVMKIWGRLYEQPNGAQDIRLWEQSMHQLLRERPRRCLNGVIVTLPVTQVTSASQASTQEQTVFLRRRLRGMGDIFGQRLPVYLILSQCDRLAGFTGAFRMALAGEVEQSLGALMDDNCLQKSWDAPWFEKSWGEIRRRIEKRVSLGLNQESEKRHRVDVVTLSWQLQLLAPRLAELLDGVFSHHPLGVPLHLRGYFLMGRGGDAPPSEDLLSGYLQSRYGFSAASEHPLTSGVSALFVRGFVPGVLLPESGLAGRNMVKERRWRLFFSGWFAFCLTLIVITGVWTYENLKFVQGRGMELRASWTHLNGIPQNSHLLEQIRWLGNLQDVMAEFQAPVPWYISSWFIYHGQGKALNQMWVELLATRLRPALLAWLAQGAAADIGQDRPDRLLPYIQFYLALTGQPGITPETAAIQHIVSNVLGETHPRLEKIFTAQLTAMLRHPGTPAERNSEFLEALRRRWQQVGSGSVFLRNVAGLKGLSRVSLEEVFSHSFLDTFTLSDKLVGTGFPRLYTAKAVQILDFNPDSPFLELYIALRQAIFNPESPTVSRKEKALVIQDIEETYYQYYGEFWQQFLETLSLRPITNAAQLSTLLLKLGTPGQSPLEELMEVVVANTQIVPDSASAGSGAQALTKAAPQKPAPPKVPPKAASTEMAQAVMMGNLARSFSEYAHFKDKSGNNTGAMDRTTQLMGQLYTAIHPALTGSGGTMQAFDIMKSHLAGNEGAIPWAGDLIAGFPVVPAQLMDDVYMAIIKQLFRGAAEEINLCWQSQIRPVWEGSLENKYPFNSSGKDASPAAVEAFVGKGGVFDQFATRYLKPFASTYIDTNGRTGYKPKEVLEATIPLSPAVWEQMSLVSDLRRLLFSASDRMTLYLDIRVLTMNPEVTLLRLDSDSGVLSARHGPPQWQMFKWSGNRPDAPLVLGLYNDGLLLAEAIWQGPWRWLRWLDSGRVTPMGFGEYRVDINQRQYCSEFIVRPSGQRMPADIFGRLHVPEQLL